MSSDFDRKLIDQFIKYSAYSRDPAVQGDLFQHASWSALQCIQHYRTIIEDSDIKKIGNPDKFFGLIGFYHDIGKIGGCGELDWKDQDLNVIDSDSYVDHYKLDSSQTSISSCQEKSAGLNSLQSPILESLIFDAPEKGYRYLSGLTVFKRKDYDFSESKLKYITIAERLTNFYTTAFQGIAASLSFWGSKPFDTYELARVLRIYVACQYSFNEILHNITYDASSDKFKTLNPYIIPIDNEVVFNNKLIDFLERVEMFYNTEFYESKYQLSNDNSMFKFIVDCIILGSFAEVFSTTFNNNLQSRADLGIKNIHPTKPLAQSPTRSPLELGTTAFVLKKYVHNTIIPEYFKQSSTLNSFEILENMYTNTKDMTSIYDIYGPNVFPKVIVFNIEDIFDTSGGGPIDKISMDQFIGLKSRGIKLAAISRNPNIISEQSVRTQDLFDYIICIYTGHTPAANDINLVYCRNKLALDIQGDLSHGVLFNLKRDKLVDTLVKLFYGSDPHTPIDAFKYVKTLDLQKLNSMLTNPTNDIHIELIKLMYMNEIYDSTQNQDVTIFNRDIVLYSQNTAYSLLFNIQKKVHLVKTPNYKGKNLGTKSTVKALALITYKNLLRLDPVIRERRLIRVNQVSGIKQIDLATSKSMDKQIWIFYDYHIPYQHNSCLIPGTTFYCNDPTTCQEHFFTVLEQLIETSPGVVDFYMEDHWKTPLNYSRQTGKELITETRDLFQRCNDTAKLKLRCKIQWPNLRYHLSDIRSTEQSKYGQRYYDYSNISFIHQLLHGTTHKLPYYSVMDWIKNIGDDFSKIGDNNGLVKHIYTHQNYMSEFVFDDGYYSSLFNTERIMKQKRGITDYFNTGSEVISPDEIIGRIEKRILWKAYEYKPQLRDAFNNLIQTNTIHPEFWSQYSSYFTSYLSLTMDTYHLLRMFKSYNPPQKHIVIFAGGYHSKFYSQILKEEFGFDIQKFPGDVNLSDPSTPFCTQMSNTAIRFTN
jgi:hypothetical protein